MKTEIIKSLQEMEFLPSNATSVLNRLVGRFSGKENSNAEFLSMVEGQYCIVANFYFDASIFNECRNTICQELFSLNSDYHICPAKFEIEGEELFAVLLQPEYEYIHIIVFIHNLLPTSSLVTVGNCTVNPFTVISTLLPHSHKMSKAATCSLLLMAGLLNNVEHCIDALDGYGKEAVIESIRYLSNNPEVLHDLYANEVLAFDKSRVEITPWDIIFPTYSEPTDPKAHEEWAKNKEETNRRLRVAQEQAINKLSNKAKNQEFVHWFWKNAPDAAQTEVLQLMRELAGSAYDKFQS